MEPVLKQSVSASKLANVDVSQLDKINAIPNKNSDSVLMDGLCQQDQLYLNALMDEDSNNSDEENYTTQARRGTSSAWSPMVQKPVLMNKRKRLKKMRSSYAITLSLEDISYIRPSWGISKGIKRIEVNKNRKKNKKSPKSAGSTKTNPVAENDKSNDPAAAKKPTSSTETKSKQSKLAYYSFLLGLAVTVTILIVSSRSIEHYRFQGKIVRDRIQLDPMARRLKIYKPMASSQHKSTTSLELLLNVNLAQGIPIDLKHKECSCDQFNGAFNEYIRLNSGNLNSSPVEIDRKKKIEEYGHCFACLDWAERANVQIYLASGEENSFCYNVKWQSYDTLATPLVDCFEFDREQWFGLGDLQWPVSWPLNKLQFQTSKLVTNLSGEFLAASPRPRAPAPTEASVASAKELQTNNKTSLHFGSLVEFSLINSAGVHLTNLKSDFQTSIKMGNNLKNGANQLCLSTQCADKCGPTWSNAKVDKLEQYKYENNILHYSICTDSSWRNLVARSFASGPRLAHRRQQDISLVKKIRNETTAARLTEKEDHREQLNELVDGAGESRTINMNHPTTRKSAPEKIGLMERTIFKTSLEFMQTLDGQTMREFVDQIVKLNLKTSPILIIDTRWQTYVGSFKLNAALFPKAKLLFEILHNKGFKIVLTIKPYIDTAIGINNINQLLESNRLVTTSKYIQSPSPPAAAAVPQSRSTLVQDGKFSNSDENAAESNEPDDTADSKRYFLIRRKSFFSFRNETILVEGDLGATKRTTMAENLPLSFRCRESRDGYCVLVDLTQERNRIWLIEAIKRSSFLTQEADAILVGGAHPNGFLWDDDHRSGLSKLVDTLFHDEQLFALPQWTGNFKYIQLAPRQRTWSSLKSTINSVLNLGLIGWSLVHPGSVWGDLKKQDDTGSSMFQTATSGLNASQKAASQLYSELQMGPAAEEESEEELIIRWLQVAIFLPIFQMNDLKPIEKYGLGEQLQNLVKIRKLYVVPELKKNLPPTQLVASSGANSKPTSGIGGDLPYNDANKQMPLIRPVWIGSEASESIVGEQFQIGLDMIVAPVLNEGQRQKDIYLPFGFWHDELRQTNIRGGKWLRNYPIELNEIAWFTRARRR